MTHILGFDACATCSQLAIADRDGRIVLWREGYGVTPLVDPGWEDRLAERLAPVADWRPRLAGAVLGLPTYGEVESVTARQSALAREIVSHKARVVNDTALAHAGAFAEGDGPAVLLRAGATSIAWADRAGAPLGETPGLTRAARDGAVRAGGWGEALGDEGSAHWIGVEALRRTTRILDGRESDQAFADKVLAAIGVEPDALLPWISQGSPRRRAIAELAPVVMRLARAGNATAAALVDQAALHLHATLVTAWRRARGTGRPVWCASGSVFADPGLMAAVTRRVGGPPQPATLPPIGGALLLAAKLAGWAPGPAFIAALARHLDDGAQAPMMQEA